MSIKGSVLQGAKEALIDALDAKPWLVSVGIGLVDGAPGLVVSVQRKASADAKRAVDDLNLSVPLKIREVGEVRARSTTRGTGSSESSPTPPSRRSRSA
jgi:hypothetical protein